MSKKCSSGLTVGIFNTRESAEQAISEALQCGYKLDDIKIIVSKDSVKNYVDTEIKYDEAEGGSLKDVAKVGALGGVIGGTIGALLALATNLALPGIGIAVLASIAGAGSISGGLLGGLIGLGIPEETAQNYEDEVMKGNIILCVKEIPGRAPLNEHWHQ